MTADAPPAADPLALDLTPDALLRWYVDAGVDECIADAPVDRYALSARLLAEAEARRARGPAPAPGRPGAPGRPAQGPAPTARRAPDAPPPPAAPARPLAAHGQEMRSAAALASECRTLVALHAAMHGFDACPLKVTATNTVFADGNPQADLMVIGEAPGAEEDRQGLPFVGASGQLLDRMLASIGLSRQTFYITNVIPWRPPGNRKPTPQEVGLCLPFIQRHIELVDPKVILMVGGLSASSLAARNEGITKLRGKWIDYASPGLSHPVPAIATFHPAYLLRSPQMKKLAWRDLLTLRQRMRELGCASVA